MIKYNESEKLVLLSQFLSSGMDSRQFAKSRGIPHSTFCDFCHSYGSPDTSSILELMKKINVPSTIDELQLQLARERKAHEAELKRLNLELQKEKLRSKANSLLIDLAEQQYHIRIRKNSDAK